MRRLVLIRHAKSDHPPGVPDHDRPINDRGRRDAAALGSWLADALPAPGIDATAIVVSSAERAQQTWSVARSAAGEAWGSLVTLTDPDVYEASPSTLRSVALRHDTAELILIVGHNPGMGLLARELTEVSAARTVLADGFPTSTVAILQTDRDWSTALEGTAAMRLSSFATPRG